MNLRPVVPWFDPGTLPLPEARKIVGMMREALADVRVIAVSNRHIEDSRALLTTGGILMSDATHGNAGHNAYASIQFVQRSGPLSNAVTNATNGTHRTLGLTKSGPVAHVFDIDALEGARVSATMRYGVLSWIPGIPLSSTNHTVHELPELLTMRLLGVDGRYARHPSIGWDDARRGYVEVARLASLPHEEGAAQLRRWLLQDGSFQTDPVTAVIADLDVDATRLVHIEATRAHDADPAVDEIARLAARRGIPVTTSAPVW